MNATRAKPRLRSSFLVILGLLALALHPGALSASHASDEPAALGQSPGATPTVDSVNREEALLGVLGSDREAFEAEYGAPTDTTGSDEFAQGDEYGDIGGFDTMYVYWGEAGALRIQLIADPELVAARALTLAERFLPTDAPPLESPTTLDDGSQLYQGASEALEQQIPADAYETHGVGGSPGDFSVILVQGETRVAAIDIAIGAGEAYGEDPTPPAATPVPDEDEVDEAAYLEAVRAEVDELDASVIQFYDLLLTEGEATFEHFSELMDILDLWEEADGRAQELTPPPEHTALHETYTAMTSALGAASADLTAYFLAADTELDDELIDSALTSLFEADDLLIELDELLTEEGF